MHVARRAAHGGADGGHGPGAVEPSRRHERLEQVAHGLQVGHGLDALGLDSLSAGAHVLRDLLVHLLARVHPAELVGVGQTPRAGLGALLDHDARHLRPVALAGAVVGERQLDVCGLLAVGERDLCPAADELLPDHLVDGGALLLDDLAVAEHHDAALDAAVVGLPVRTAVEHLVGSDDARRGVAVLDEVDILRERVEVLAVAKLHAKRQLAVGGVGAQALADVLRGELDGHARIVLELDNLVIH